MITRLRVKNFKSLKDIDIELGWTNVLVGPNMGGKSNILDACYFLQQFLSPQPGVEGLGYALAQRGGIAEVLWKGGGESLVSLCLDLQTPDGRKWNYVLEVIAGRGGFAQIQKESLSLLSEKDAKELIVLDQNVRWLANADGTKIVAYQSTNKSVMESVPDNWDGSIVAQMLRFWKFYQLIPQAMKQANPTGSGAVLERIGQNLSAWLMTLQTRFPESFNKISEVARDVFPELTNLVTHPTAQGTVFLSSSERGLKQPVGVTQMSDGELAFLGLLSLIYCPEELSASAYFIEEPETHLHPYLITILAKLLRQKREELASQGKPLAQIFITTQSPTVVGEMLFDELLWVYKKDGRTYVERPNDREHLRRLVADKELGLGDIVYSGLLAEPQ